MTRIYTGQNTHVKITALLCLFAVTPFATYGADTSVENSVSASASSGGNTASNGEVIEGNASAHVFVETIINGKTIEHIDEHVEDSESFEYEVVNKTEDTIVETSVSAHTEVKKGETTDDKKELRENVVQEEVGRNRSSFEKLTGFFVSLFSFFTF